MKLLSRFIWLIIGILAFVFVVVTLFQIRSNHEFEEIRNSIKAEYDVQVDKMLQPDQYTGFASYVNDLCSDPSSALFLEGEQPDQFFININLHNDILTFNDVDAVWFFKADGSPFYFKSVNNLNEDALNIPQIDIPAFLSQTELLTFFAVWNNEVVKFHGSSIADNAAGHDGFVVIASILDERWVQKYENTINNSAIEFFSATSVLPEISSDVIRISRELKDYKGDKAAILNVELNLPFLELWNKTSNTDNWLIIGSLVIVILFLIVFLLVWVIAPLKRISSSLLEKKSNTIKPLLKGKTEMGEVARMIADYHLKTEELATSESIKRHIFEQAQVGIIVASARNGLVKTANPYACALLKTPEDAVLNNAIDNFMKPLSEDEMVKESFESIAFNSSLKELPILRTATKMMQEGEEVIMNTFVDLSEIKNLQNRLEEEKKKLSLAVANSGLVFCEYDFTKDELTINDEWGFIATGNNNSTHENILARVNENDRKMVLEKIESAIENQKNTFETEFRLHHPEKGIVWVHVSVLITRRDEHGKAKQLIGLLNDITERIYIQQELIKAKEKAEESDRLKSSYLGNMSHKIRTPLNTIVGFANLLTEEELDAASKENFINIIRNDTEQVLHLIDDMINIAKIDANQLDINKSEQHINGLIKELTNYYKANEKSEKIKLQTKIMLADDKDILYTDKAKLYQALDALINNAYKFTNEGSIEIGYFVNPAEKKLIVYVKDSGIGIPEDVKDKVYNRFFQVNPMTEGTGLGLTISQSIVKLLDGRLYYDSKEGEGSTFYIELPMGQ